jgi:hypothetical protein
MGEYINKGSEKLKGVTWDYVPRTKFAGTEITWQNKREVIKEKAREYKENNPEASTEECVEWGRRFARKEQKHFKSYLKGKNSYSYKGGKFLVEDQSRLEHFIKMAQMFEQQNEEYQKSLLENNQEEE